MSTGGCPQVVVKKIEMFKDIYNVVCIEWSQISWHFLVQRNRAIELLGNNFISLSENKEYDLFNVIEDYKPDYLMIEEIAETFIPKHILKRLYSKERDYKIFETTHSSYSTPNQKQYLPDKFIFVSPHSAMTFKDIGVPFDIIEYPIDKKERNKEWAMNKLGLDPEWKHVINVGLFTPGKNQGYAFEMCEKLKNHKIKFHFIGNQASNFENYWKPLMENKPENCVVWGERDDVDLFLQASDAFLFTSILELNPISIKESLEYGLPTLIHDLPTYYGKYNNVKNITFLTGNINQDTSNFLKVLNIDNKKPKIKIVHLVMNPENREDISEKNWESTMWKQRKSIECWDKLKNYFDDYVLRYSIVNRTKLPKETCVHPEIIDDSKEFKNNPPVLSYGHYGAYMAHKNGILENFTEDLDALIIVEGDVVSDYNPMDFYNKVISGYEMAKNMDARLITFAGPVFMSGDNFWDKTIDLGEWYKVPHFLLGSTYMIMKKERNNIIEKLNTKGWHSPDFWLAWNYNEKETILSTKDKTVYQLEGYSVLDYKEKDKWQ